jgi:signal transduction histidine kinase
VALPFILAFGFALPVLLAWGIYQHRKNLDNPETKLKYCFLVAGYQKTIPFWEAYYMLRRVILVVISILIPYLSSTFAVLLCTWILVEAMLLQIKYKPFERDIENTLEKLSLFTCCVIFFVGMYFKTVTMDPVPKLVFDIIMMILFIGTSVVFVIYWLINYLRVIALSIGGKIGEKMITYLKNPENLKKKEEAQVNQDQDNENSVLVEMQNTARKESSDDNSRSTPVTPVTEKKRLSVSGNFFSTKKARVYPNNMTNTGM